MAVAEVLVIFFVMGVGGIAALLAATRGAFLWWLFATLIFLFNTLYAPSIPFVTNGSGEVIVSSSNIALLGINMIAFSFSFVCLVKYSIEALKGIRIKF